MKKRIFAKEVEMVQANRDSLVINGKTFFYDCTHRHSHNALCLTQDMLDTLSEVVYK